MYLGYKKICWFFVCVCARKQINMHTIKRSLTIRLVLHVYAIRGLTVFTDSVSGQRQCWSEPDQVFKIWILIGNLAGPKYRTSLKFNAAHFNTWWLICRANTDTFANSADSDETARYEHLIRIYTVCHSVYYYYYYYYYYFRLKPLSASVDISKSKDESTWETQGWKC